ncbi:hypothetical protein EV421DRAFT_1688299, partial [Armillaria borealis]
FSSSHPLRETHHVRVYEAEKRKVPNFVGGMLPRRDRGDWEYYCAMMLTIFKPWRTGQDLKIDKETTWDTAFTEFNFSSRHQQIMLNFNLQYECLDARDDYRA